MMMFGRRPLVTVDHALCGVEKAGHLGPCAQGVKDPHIIPLP
jgi:hypothetical protein